MTDEKLAYIAHIFLGVFIRAFGLHPAINSMGYELS